MKKRIIKSGAISIAALAITLMSALPAFAHTTIEPSEGAAGSYGIYSLKVPNESDTASTIKLEVELPSEHPLSYVGVTDQDGWNVTVEKGEPSVKLEGEGGEVTEVVKKITWDGGKIGPGKFAVFHVYLGPLPEDADELVLKAVQTYDDGEVSRWVEEQKGEEEPEFPAPVLKITEATGDEHGSSSSASSEEKAESKDSDSSNTVGFVGIGLGAVALVAALFALSKKK